MDDLQGKRLLFLGATGLLCNAVETAQRMGVYTIVTDYYPDAMAKKAADKSYDVSTTDIDALERIAREEKIDGVFTGFSDVNLYSARDLCDRLGLPFYATREQLDMTTNKLKFKEMCRRHGVPTMKQYELDSRCLPEHLSRIEYPVIVKPADSYASKGVSVCYDEDALKKGVETAVGYSKGNSVIVEAYLDPRRYGDFGAYYTIKDGDIRLSAMCDRVMYIGQGGVSPLPMQQRLPSKYLPAYLESGVDERVRDMFRAEGFRNGTLFMQGFAAEGNFYFFEMGFRLNGAQEYVFVNHANQNNALELYIRYALTGSAGDFDMNRENPAYGCACCNLLLLLLPGKIQSCSGLDTVRELPGVLNVTQLLSAGDTVGVQGTLGQVLARIHFVKDSWEQVDRQIEKIMNLVKVRDEDNNDLLIGVKKL